MRAKPLFLAMLATLGTAHAAETAPPCLNYWDTGPAKGCQPAPKKATPAPTQPSPTAPAVAAPATSPSPTGLKSLKERIKDFKEDYGKPPTEFIAFYLEPTPENAMKWVHKYQELLNRSQQLAYVWTQAETLYQKELAAGRPASSFDDRPLTPVKDFGIPVTGIDSPLTGGTPAGPLPAELANLPAFPGSPQSMGSATGGAPVNIAQSFSGVGNTPVGNLGALTGLPNLGGSPQGTLSGAALGSLSGGLQGGLGGSLGGSSLGGAGLPNLNAPTEDKPVNILYYFSASCPYCQKFEPELRDMLTQLGTKAYTTCVDMTPQFGPATDDMPAPRRSNTNGLDCSWRLPKENEEVQFGIRQTPTLLIQRTKNGPFERFTGYTPATEILNHILNPSPQSLTPTQ